MPQYTLTLTWTKPGGGGPVAIHNNRNSAMNVAHRNQVRNWAGGPIHDNPPDIVQTDTGAIWQVMGANEDICKMVRTWLTHGNVTVAFNPLLDCRQYPE
jgi:hypothetical protein